MHASPESTAVSPHPAAHRGGFAALRHPGYRWFFIGTMTAMLGDNVEHVISYWAMFQRFHSPTLGGFAVISHWVPFLLFSGYSGALADRFDPRRIIQIGMVLFMGVSLCWSLLIATDSLQIWQAWVLLSIHGLAGVLWSPASQLLIHDIVGEQDLPSAVRLAATARYAGMFLGPAVGSTLLLLLGPAHSILVNVLIYLPMLLWLWRAPYGPKFRTAGKAVADATVHGLGDAWATLRIMRDNPVLLTMTLLAGGAAFFVGNAYQAQMPQFATELGHGNPGFAYWMLLAADAIGALIGAVVLESRGLLPPRPRTAVLLGMLWCLALGGFALARTYPLAVLLLLCAGFLELSFSSMAMALVQLNAPPRLRGHVIGTYSMAALGLRCVSGITVGVLGSVLGIHHSLSLAAAVLLAGLALLLTTQSRYAESAIHE
jgi:MFS family permease